MLGEDNEYGIVTENSEEALYEGIKNIVDDPKKLKHYKRMAQIRGKIFNTQQRTASDRRRENSPSSRKNGGITRYGRRVNH